MDTAIIEPEPELRLRLIPAADDSPLSSQEYQRELADFAKSLRAQGIRSSARAFSFDAEGAVGGLSGEFTLIVTAIAPIVTGVAGAAGAWLHAKYGRKMRVKFRDVEIEAPTLDELQKALHLVEESLRRTEPR